MRLVLATRNVHKVDEMSRILVDAGLAYDVVGVADVAPDLPDVAETADSFAGNAELKARAVAAATGELCVADDSGLEVDALHGMPGIFSARWSGRHGDDRANLELLLAQLADVPDPRRTARFVCAVVLAGPEGSVDVVHGEMTGRIIRTPLGDNGFGYDPIFVPDGLAVTSAQLPSAEKDAISHRGKALQALVPLLRTRTA